MRSKLLIAVAVVLCVGRGEVRAQQQFSFTPALRTSPESRWRPWSPPISEYWKAASRRRSSRSSRSTGRSKSNSSWITASVWVGRTSRALKDGIKGLVEALPENLEVTIVTTAPQPRFLVRPTTDKAMMIEGLSRLAPDTGAGRFVESMNEATQRIEKDKTDHFPVIIIVGHELGRRQRPRARREANLRADPEAADDRPRRPAEFDDGISDRRRQSDTGWSGGNAGDPRTVREHRGPNPARHAASGDRQAGRSKPREAEPSVPDHR